LFTRELKELQNIQDALMIISCYIFSYVKKFEEVV